MKFSTNLFLGVAEWNRFQKVLNDQMKTILLANTDEYGIVKQINLPEIGNIDLANSFYVSKAGTPYDEVVIHQGVAIDLDGNIIINKQNKNYKIPNDSQWYYVAIRHKITNSEKGTISVDTNGIVTGVGTEFTQLFRGGTEFNSRIIFTNSAVGNFQNYEVAKVIDDESMILMGDFIAESDLEFAVFGTFLDGYNVSQSNSKIFEYDSYEMFLILESEVDQLLENREFLIAKVRNNGIDLTLEDNRVKWWKTEAQANLSSLDRDIVNNLLGVDSIKFDVLSAPKDENLVQLSWNFKCSSFTINTNDKKISLLIGEGGRFKDTSYFTAGDFTNWRIYKPNGSYSTIIDSQKSGTQIVITLDHLFPDDFPSNEELIISPPFEEIEFKTSGQIGYWNEKIQKIDSFNISDRSGILRLKVTNSSTRYNIEYRYKTLNDYTEWKEFIPDSVGYYDETSFDQNGILNSNILDRVRVTYDPSVTYFFLLLKEHSTSYQQTIERLDTGELMGVNKTLFKNENPLITLSVGGDKRYQHFGNEVINGIPVEFFQLSANITIVLNTKRYDGKDLRDGNTFFIHITQHINLDSFDLFIVQDYSNATNFTELMRLTKNDVSFIRNNKVRAGDPLSGGMLIRATWSEDYLQWVLSYETDQVPINTVNLVEGDSSVLDKFDPTSKEGIEAPYFGWRLRDDWNDRYVKISNSSFDEGGSTSFTLNADNIPEHDHYIFANEGGSNDNPNVSGSQWARVANSTGGNMGYFITFADYSPNVFKTSKSGSANPQSVTFNPSYKKFVAIQKVV